MKRIKISIHLIIVIVLCLTSFTIQAQKIYQPEKQGIWSFWNRMNACDGMVDKTAYTRNLTAIGEDFHQNHPMLRAIKGFDFLLELENSCYSESHQRPCDYCSQGALYFNFQIFYIESGKELKWKIEPPHWTLRVNSAWTGHGTNFGGLDGYRAQVDDPKMENALDKAIAKISEFFCVFEIEKEIAPGIRLYKYGNLVVFNEERPDYWIPVTVKEVMDAKMSYWKIKPDDKIVYDHFVNEYQKFTPDELNSLAYEGSDDAIIKVNAKKDGLQIMRFNPEYWNRSLPKSSIQFMTMYYHVEDRMETAEFIRDNGHPDYTGMFMEGMDVTRLAGFIVRK
ncbi:MAG: hypothetical protein Q8S54_11600 [Bacteroidota bacterium]|nr:hypothetical protein [Odoribacter sp.]MDP3643821.1 hypothetical protein [Bacteroidota bacterium]